MIQEYINKIDKYKNLYQYLLRKTKKGMNIFGIGNPFLDKDYKPFMELCKEFISLEGSQFINIPKVYIDSSIILVFSWSEYKTVKKLREYLPKESILYLCEDEENLLVTMQQVHESQSILFTGSTDISSFQLQQALHINGLFKLTNSNKADLSVGYIKVNGNASINNESIHKVQIRNLIMEDKCKIKIEGQGVLRITNAFMGENSRIRIYSGELFLDEVDLGRNCNINTYNNIQIGKDSMLSWNVDILDGDGHTLEYNDKTNTPRPILIGDHVWIGSNSTVLKGTTLSEGCVVAARSIVKGFFPPRSLLAGNPARVIQENVDWDYQYIINGGNKVKKHRIQLI